MVKSPYIKPSSPLTRTLYKPFMIHLQGALIMAPMVSGPQVGATSSRSLQSGTYRPGQKGFKQPRIIPIHMLQAPQVGIVTILEALGFRSLPQPNHSNPRVVELRNPEPQMLWAKDGPEFQASCNIWASAAANLRCIQSTCYHICRMRDYHIGDCR